MISKTLLDNADDAAEFLTMIGNAKRLAIMAQLLNDELTVGTLAKRVDSANPRCRSIWRSFAPRASSLRARTLRQSSTVSLTTRCSPSSARFTTFTAPRSAWAIRKEANDDRQFDPTRH